MDADELKRKNAERFAYLQLVYDATGGSTLGDVLRSDITAQLGLDAKASDVIAEYLVQEGLLEWTTMGLISITHYGVREIEQAVAEPDTPTEHFPPLAFTQNVIHVESMVGSAIQQGSSDSTQSVGAPALDVNALRDVIAQLEAALAAIVLEDDERAEASAQIATMNAQLGSPKPRPAILRESLATMRRITEGLVAAGAAPQLPTLLDQLGRMIG